MSIFTMPFVLRWLKYGIPLLSGIVLIFDAATIGRWNSYFSNAGFGYYGGGIAPNNALLAACIFNLLYFGAAIWFFMKRPDSIFISVMVDTIVLGFLFLFNIGCVGSVTSLASAFSGWYGDNGNGVGALMAVTCAFGWILVFAIGILLGLEVYITLKNYGTDMQTWKTPLHILMNNGPRHSQPAMAEEGKMPVSPNNVVEAPYQQQAPFQNQAPYQAVTTN